MRVEVDSDAAFPAPECTDGHDRAGPFGLEQLDKRLKEPA